METKLYKVNKSELVSDDNEYKYVITAYEDITRIEYYEKDFRDKNSKELIRKNTYELPSCHDIQVAEKIIELRKLFKDF